MTSARARLGHVGGTSVGFGLVGVSAFVFLAVGPRALGVQEYSAAAVAWTCVMILGIGLATPGEQAITRATASAGTHAGVTGVTLRLWLVVAATLTVPLASALGAPVLGLTGPWALAVPVGAAGWALTATTRGLLAGRAAFGWYTTVLVTEAGLRLALCAVAFLVPDVAAVALAAAIGVPLAGCALVGWLGTRRAPESPNQDATPASDFSVFVGVALLIQVTSSTAPLWLGWRYPTGVEAGVMVTVASYFRIPLVLLGGVAAVTLSGVSRGHATGRTDVVRGHAVSGIAMAAGATTVMVTVLALLSEPLLGLLYGSALPLDPGTIAVFAVGSLLLVMGTVGTQVVFGTGLGRLALAAWAASAVVTTLLLAALAWSVGGAATAIAVGCGVAAGGVALAMRGLRTPASVR